LFSVLLHDRSRRLQPDLDAASFVDIGALGDNAPEHIGGSCFMIVRRRLSV
jgi:hypothetical protein